MSSPSILTQSMWSEDTTSGLTTNWTAILAQAMSEASPQARVRAQSPAGSANSFLDFTTSTVFTTSVRGPENSGTYDR